jgi:hypothetical protein
MTSRSIQKPITVAALNRGVLMCAVGLGRTNAFMSKPSPSSEGLEHQDDKKSRGSP